ncbi:MAG: deoxyribodipyrimidine photo-lyase [Candidatus Aramenus sulfurataquae]|uniref:DNA photolyase family protein n=2 Tax=Candidatus Aramenus sulfurataquae TaxID=1326980 RepID=A0AAE3FM28_9CREN|nr:DNA photolyase family protein [Candidatus Aramenus sulfurataquae]
MLCAFVFRRDLRLDDNTGLISAMRECEQVAPIFVIDPRQVENNEYKSEKALTFMFNSLRELDQEIRDKGGKLFVFKGIAEEVIAKLLDKVEAVYLNEDYTPFSKMRDLAIAEACKRKGKAFRSFEDYLLTPKAEFKGFSNFTSFYNHVKGLKVREPVKNDYKNFFTGKLMEEAELPEPQPAGRFKGGRKEGLYLVERAKHIDYSRRDYPAEGNVSYLSPHLKFGTVSPREVYYALRENLAFTRQLFWRDFYTLLAYYNERVFQEPFKAKFKDIKWENDRVLFELWKRGKTGYPIVDAGMRELNNTGYMHNRVRMISAFLLTKVFLVDWRWGEKYFAQKLVDYDPSVNNGNWQWVASTGVDYTFRVFDPWKQQKKFDPNAKYIKTWVEELRDYPPHVIHEAYSREIPGYPRPVVDWRERVEKARELYFREI